MEDHDTYVVSLGGKELFLLPARHTAAIPVDVCYTYASVSSPASQRAKLRLQ